MTRFAISLAIGTVVALVTANAAFAQSSRILSEDATRYMALGDSLAAGYKAVPVTNGYAYLLYQEGTFDAIPHTLFANAAVPGATSADVLHHQVPQALIPFGDGGFNAGDITLTVGGNDLLAILHYLATHQDPQDVQQFASTVLTQYGQNLASILFQLRQGLPAAKIFVANQYTIPEIEVLVPLTAQAITALNNVIAQVVGLFADHVYLVDVFSAFKGRNNLLLVERHGAAAFETHITSLGHRVMADAFADVIAANK
jgi:lysophospholipase L1-like esterase